MVAFTNRPVPNRHILKNSTSMHESSDSQCFKTTTGIQLGPVAFDESRLVIIFLTISGVIEILCSFRLVLEGKKIKRYPSHKE